MTHLKISLLRYLMNLSPGCPCLRRASIRAKLIFVRARRILRIFSSKLILLSTKIRTTKKLARQNENPFIVGTENDMSANLACPIAVKINEPKNSTKKLSRVILAAVLTSFFLTLLFLTGCGRQASKEPKTKLADPGPK